MLKELEKAQEQKMKVAKDAYNEFMEIVKKAAEEFKSGYGITPKGNSVEKEKPARLTPCSMMTEGSIHEAIGTMRRVKRIDEEDEVNFEWPSEGQILAMPRDQPFTLEKLMW